ncbi:unnamed protein product [Bursaphelenchus xylophilus]|uniref:(pine wood nematode) hypothetical protein n=1 Tax=Bursaphelenchus xylophilus TaxID=6326 RepID=A0A1I7RMA2_BURXY|nr:unnamed protein product [Bursaphelenchus xylophilus]CAG9118328.1 unnamed protein product [Bursaphelenchus xylophilus]
MKLLALINLWAANLFVFVNAYYNSYYNQGYNYNSYQDSTNCQYNYYGCGAYNNINYDYYYQRYENYHPSYTATGYYSGSRGSYYGTPGIAGLWLVCHSCGRNGGGK